jgi:hypothetical protein
MQFSWTPREAWEPGTTGWAVRATTYGSGPGTLATGLGGDTVLVEARDGRTKHVTLGNQIAVQNGGKYAVYAVAVATQAQPRPVAQTPQTPSAKGQRRVTPSAGATKGPDGLYDAYDLVRPWGHVDKRWVIRREDGRFENPWHAALTRAAEFTGYARPETAALAALKEEGEVLNQQINYERANGWSTD